MTVSDLPLRFLVRFYSALADRANLFSTVLLVLLGALILLGPALANQLPLLFYDTAHYFMIGEAIANVAGGWIGWAAPEAPPPPAPAAPPAAAAPDAAAAAAGAGEPVREGGIASIAGGRSPLYSWALYVLWSQAGVWAPVFAQAAIAAWAMLRLVDALAGRRRPLAFLAAAAALSAISSVGVSASLLMPDIFGGVLVAAAAALLAEPMRFWERGALALALAGAAVTHTTTLALLAFAILTFGAAWTLARWGGERLAPPPGAMPTLLAALVAAVGFNTLYGWAAERVSGEKLTSAPYLTARVIADGPGADYLAEACAAPGPSRLETCVFAGRRYRDHNDLLWGHTIGAENSFLGLPQETRLRISQEQTAFVAAVFRARFAAQTAASLRNGARQLLKVRPEPLLFREVGDWSRRFSLFEASGLLRLLPERPFECEGRCPLPRLASNWTKAVGLTNIIATLSIFALLGLWLAKPAAFRAALGDREGAYFRVTVFVALALVFNALLCGAASAPHDRYQYRIAWLAPLLIGLVAWELARGPRRPGGGGATAR